jgi:fatty acid desaturase
MSHQAPTRKALRDFKLLLNNNCHAVHHDLPHVPWFALPNVYETSCQQYTERSAGFLVKGYGEWVRLYAFAQVVHPVHDNLPDLIHGNPSASTSPATP